MGMGVRLDQRLCIVRMRLRERGIWGLGRGWGMEMRVWRRVRGMFRRASIRWLLALGTVVVVVVGLKLEALVAMQVKVEVGMGVLEVCMRVRMLVGLMDGVTKTRWALRDLDGSIMRGIRDRIIISNKSSSSSSKDSTRNLNKARLVGVRGRKSLFEGGRQLHELPVGVATRRGMVVGSIQIHREGKDGMALSFA